jgi:hypothetical protein
VSWTIVVREQNAMSQFAPPFTRDFLTQTSQFVFIVRTIYDTIFLKIVSHDYPLSQTNEAIIFPADGTLLNFFGGVRQGASIACSVFFFYSGSK